MKIKVSALQVCHSNAGYYAGRYCDEGPYSRESDYFRTRDEAQAWVDFVACQDPEAVKPFEVDE